MSAVSSLRGWAALGLAGLTMAVASSAAAQSRRVVVNPADPQAFPTLAAAAPGLRAGDTLWLAPGSGPYREALFIPASGTAEAPIIIEGNGNEITGFDPVGFEALPDGRHVATIKPEYPFVLRHLGRRVVEASSSGKFSGGIEYDRETRRLFLPAGASIEGWEVSVRPFAVRITNTSHHVYRDLVASGSKNDGFNLHGSGRGLRFERIVGRQNLDEGFSAHEASEAEIDGGEFYENDNGMLSGQRTKTRLSKVDFYNNLGLGVGFNGEASVEADDLRSWGNGMMQLFLREGTSVRWTRVEIYRNAYGSRPLVSHMESARWQTPKTLEVPPTLKWLAEPPRLFDDVGPSDTAR